MARYTQHAAGQGGWTDWIRPVPAGYRACCCDCGLVHEIEFRVADGIEPSVEFRVRRHNRATAQVPRAMKKGDDHAA
jgi:hypothetical protein